MTVTEKLAKALQDTGHDITEADLLDCLATAGLTIERSSLKASQAYLKHLIESSERAA